MISRIERNFITADLARLEGLIAKMTSADFLTRMGLESRRDELQQTLASMEVTDQPLASATLFFGGKPVVGNRGIESGFGADAISKFQDIVSKVSAAKQGG